MAYFVLFITLLQERVEEGEIDPHTPLFINITYSGVPNKRVVPNSHAGGEISTKKLSVHAQINVQGGKICPQK